MRADPPHLKLARLTACLVVAVSALIRWELLGTRSLWFDEGYSLFVAGLGLRGIVSFLRWNDAHPPGYYLLLSWWMHSFGRELTWLRLPSLLAGVGSVALAGWLAARWCGPWCGTAAALLVAVNAFQVYASNELRMYAPLTLVVLGAVAVLDRALHSRRGVWWVACGALVALALYVSYFAVVPVVLGAAWVTWRYRTEALRGLALAGVVAAVLYAPWVPYLSGLMARNPQQWVIRPSVQGWDLLPYALSLVTSQTYGGYLPNTVTYHRGSLLVWPYLPPLLPFAVGAAFGVLVLRRGLGSLAPVLWLGGVLVAVAASAVLGREAAYPRNLLFLQPFAAVTVAAGLGEVCRRVGGRAGVLAAGALFAAAVAPSWAGLQNLQSGHPAFDAYRFDRAAAYLSRQLGPRDLVVYFPTGVELAFGYYLDRPVRSVSLLLPVERWNEDEVRALAVQVRPYLRDARRVWLVVSLPGPWTRLVRPLEDGLEAVGLRSTEARDFLGVQVLGYRRGP